MDWKNIDWSIGIFLVTYHLFLIVAVPLYLSFTFPSLSVILITIILGFLTGMSITMGYHRYFSHRTYTTNKILEVFLLFFGTLAMEGSALKWSHDHRLHHKHTDTDLDPYGVDKGFWHAHCLWLFKKPKPVDMQLVPDLAKNKLVLFQNTYYVPLTFAANIFVCFLLGFFLQDYVGVFLFCWWFRVFCVHHSTWFINSLAHMWGDKIYSKELSAVDNYILALLTFGEGYHNYHHTFASDYRNGIKWYHFDPGKWVLSVLYCFGFVSNLKKMNPHTIKAVIVREDKQILLAKLSKSFSAKREEWFSNVRDLSEALDKKIDHIKLLIQQYKEAHDKKEEQKKRKQEIKLLKKSIAKDWTSWCKLANEIMSRA